MGIHSDRLRSDFEAHPDRSKYQHDYEKDFLSYLEGLIHEADAWIARERGNAAGPGKMTKMSDSQKQNVVNCQEQADEAMKNAEDLAEKGDVAASKLEVERADKLREEAKEIKEKATFISQGE